eukprot:gene25121-60525_t
MDGSRDARATWWPCDLVAVVPAVGAGAASAARRRRRRGWAPTSDKAG